MVPQWKRWLGAAAVLLLVGAGCEASVQPDASLDIKADVSGETRENGKADGDASSSLELETDAAIDAAIGESEADADAALEESSDADLIDNDSAELNAYGKTYVESETR